VSRARISGAAVAASVLAAAAAWAAGPPETSPFVEAGWTVQSQWQSIQVNGSFDYAMSLTTWNSRGEVKETYLREVTVRNRDGKHVSIVRSAVRNGKDETAKARREQQRERSQKREEKTEPIPSPFDPEFRAKYEFRLDRGENGAAKLEFHPRERFDKALEGSAGFDTEGRLRSLHFTLARLPVFTKRLEFEIEFDERGYPEHVRSEGEVSLVVWKRRFETVVDVSGIEPADVPVAERRRMEEP